MSYGHSCIDARISDGSFARIALCRRTHQVVAYVIGNRGESTRRLLWSRIPESYRRGILYSDFWEGYRKVLPDDHHRAVGKSSAQTSHVERWSNTLGQQAISFCKKDAVVLEVGGDA